jgi:hypothetical protein
MPTSKLRRTQRLCMAISLALLSLPATAQFAAVQPLSGLDGSNGFRLDGVAAYDRSGRAVSGAGDVNGDGIDDLIIGAFGADPNGSNSGSSYVVFGRSTGFAAAINLSTLDGSNGFRLDGVAAADYSGFAISAAGDLNGDGIDDLIIGAWGADPNGDRSGSSYVVFGRSTGFAAAISFSTLNGGNSLRLDGVEAGDLGGRAVSTAGDVNGDGIDDLIIGAEGADPNGNVSGSSYVVFGRSTGFDPAISLSTLDGSNGFRLDGVATYDRSGFAVSVAGDVNGDGIDDLIIGAPGTSPNGIYSGSSFVVFGRSTGFAAAISLSALDGRNGFRLDGVAASDFSGGTVSAAGDVNGDGLDDLIISASGADPNGSYSGSSYVVFGRSTGFAAAINLSSLNGSTGFRLDGVAARDYSGATVAAAGDVNGDGINDLIIGADSADPNGYNSGSSYVVFGRSRGFAAATNLSTLDGTNGFRLDGVAAGNGSGRAVSAAGDLNGDGLDDLIIGAPYADQNGGDSGSSYVVFGKTACIFQDGFETD